jgi:hypothetical protein
VGFIVAKMKNISLKCSLEETSFSKGEGLLKRINQGSETVVVVTSLRSTIRLREFCSHYSHFLRSIAINAELSSIRIILN